VAHVPENVREFLGGRRFVVAGVSHDIRQPANAVFRKLRDTGYEVVPVNPRMTQAEGAPCYPSVSAVPGSVDGVVVVTHPDVSADVVRDSLAHGVRRLWFHRSFGTGSVSEAAVHACEAQGVQCIVGGCPLMYCEPVDLGHRCMRWWLDRQGRLPR